MHWAGLKRVFKVISAVYKSAELSAKDLFCYATLKCLFTNNSFANIIAQKSNLDIFL